MSKTERMLGNLQAQVDELYGMVQNAATRAQRAQRAVATMQNDVTVGNPNRPISGGLIVSETVPASAIVNAAITETQLADAAVAAAKLAVGAVTAEAIAVGAITANSIANDAVTAAKIAINAVTAEAIATGAITETKIASDAVTSPKIAAGSIIAGKIGAGAIVAADIASGAITTEKITAGAVTADTIATNAITAVKVAAGSIIAGKIGALAVTAAEIAAGSVTSEKIYAGAVVADAIAANAIIAVKIAAGAITADKLTSELVLSTTVVAGAASPGARIEISSAGIKGYDATNTQRSALNADGSGWLGSSTALAWTTAGVLTATGITVQTAGSGARVEMSSAGIKLYNASARVWELTTAGMKFYDAAGTGQRGQILNDGSGWLGDSGKFSWTALGVVTMDGSIITNATIPGAAIATGGITATQLASGSVTTAKISDVGADKITTGTLGSTTITIGASGKIIDADGSYWDSTGLHLVSSGTLGDCIEWKVGGFQKGGIYADSSVFYGGYPSGGIFEFSSLGAYIAKAVGSTIYSEWVTAGINMSAGSNLISTFESTNGNLLLRNRLYPGNAGQQTTGYVAWDGTNVQVAGADLYLPNYLKLAQTGAITNVTPGPADEYFAFKDSAGNTRYVPCYTSMALSD